MPSGIITTISECDDPQRSDAPLLPGERALSLESATRWHPNRLERPLNGVTSGVSWFFRERFGARLCEGRVCGSLCEHDLISLFRFLARHLAEWLRAH
jgi:hypothetical protein